MIQKIILASDSTTDLSAELIALYDLKILPLTVALSGKSYADGTPILHRRAGWHVRAAATDSRFYRPTQRPEAPQGNTPPSVTGRTISSAAMRPPRARHAAHREQSAPPRARLCAGEGRQPHHR